MTLDGRGRTVHAVSPWLIALVVLVVAAIAYVAAMHEKKRRAALTALAAELGLSFDPSADASHDDEYAHFDVFRQGHSRVASNTLTGTVTVDDRPYRVKMGDFRYKVTHHTSKGSSTSTHRFSYLILHLPFASVPKLLIRREGILDKIAGALGFDDIDFESEEFSRKFLVKSPDKRFAYDVIHPRMMAFLLETKPPSIDIEQEQCCIMDGKRRWEPKEFRARLRWTQSFFDHWPEHLVAQLNR